MSSIRFGRGQEYHFFRREDLRARWELQAAVQFLNGFRGDAVMMSNFRREMPAATPANLTDEQVIQSLARSLVAGEYLVALPRRINYRDMLDLGETAPAQSQAPRSSTPAEVVEDEPTFARGHDGVAQAAVLIAAAQAAFPFCEECARHTAAEMQAAGR